MKHFFLWVIAGVFFAVPVWAQVYDGGDTIYTLSGSVQDYGTSNVYVGDTTPNNTLNIFNAGVLKNGAAYVGRGTAALGNKVIVTGLNSAWLNSSILYVGYFGSSNSVEIKSGAIATNGVCYLGYLEAAAGNRVWVDSGSRWTNSYVMVGRQGDGNSLLISGGARVDSVGGGSCSIGREPQSSNNCVMISGSETQWIGTGNLMVGQEGDGNTLVISNGARVVSNAGSISSDDTASGNTATVTGSNSLWQTSLSMTVGSSGDNGSLIIADGGRVESVTGFIGSQIPSSGNSVFLDGSNSIWQIHGMGASHLYVGYYGDNSSLTIENGGRLENISGFVGYFSTGANASIAVRGVGSVWYNDQFMELGAGASNCELRIEDEGRVRDRDGRIGTGAAAKNNRLVVSGQGSVWTNSYKMSVGLNGSENRLELDSGGCVYTRYGYVGAMSGANSNVVHVSNSWSKISASQSIQVGAEGNSGNRIELMQSGALETPVLQIESNNAVFLQGGQLLISEDFDAAQAGDFDFSSGLLFVGGTLRNLDSVPSGGHLKTESVVGDLNLNGVFTPGIDIGDTLLDGDLDMGASATLAMNIGGYEAGTEYDRLTVNGSATLNGVLKFYLDAPFVPTNWSCFKLFDWNTPPTGSFTEIHPPEPPAGLRWTTSQLYSKGTIGLLSTDPDSDGDGLPDQWEFDCFGENVDPLGNPDDDPQNTFEEYIAGTDPTNPLSFFRITAWEHDLETSRFFIEWDSVTGRYYNVNWCNALSNTFILMDANIEYPKNSFRHKMETTGFYNVTVRLKE